MAEPIKESSSKNIKIVPVKDANGIDSFDLILLDKVRISCFNLGHAHKLFLELDCVPYIKEA